MPALLGPVHAAALIDDVQRGAAGHMGAIDAMAPVYRDGLHGQPPGPHQVRRWHEILDRELAR